MSCIRSVGVSASVCLYANEMGSSVTTDNFQVFLHLIANKIFKLPVSYAIVYLIISGKVHGSLARAGKVKGQTPKVSKLTWGNRRFRTKYFVILVQAYLIESCLFSCQHIDGQDHRRRPHTMVKQLVDSCVQIQSVNAYRTVPQIRIDVLGYLTP